MLLGGDGVTFTLKRQFLMEKVKPLVLQTLTYS